MAFWIFMLIMNLLIPITMIAIGKHYSTNPPKNINSWSGYRTTMSMKTTDTWIFAHRYFGRIWFPLGVILLLVSVIAMLFVWGKDTDTMGWYGGGLCMIQCVFLVLPIIPTERALKKQFDRNGNPR